MGRTLIESQERKLAFEFPVYFLCSSNERNYEYRSTFTFGVVLDYKTAMKLFDARNSASIQKYLDASDSQLVVARELKSRVKLTSNLYELRYLLPIFVKGARSDSPEVIEGAVYGLARFATERWQDYESESLPGTQAVLIKLLERKHKGIRGAAAQALMATALHTGRLEVADHPLQHASGKLRASAIGSLLRCREAGVDIGPLVPLLIGKIPRADKNEKKAIVRVLKDWIVESRPTEQHFGTLKRARELLQTKDDGLCAQLASEIASFLDTHSCGNDIDLLFEQLMSDSEAERRVATKQMHPLFDKLVVVPEDVASKLAIALEHEDAQVREDIARIVSNAEWRRGKPMSLLMHPDEAVRKGVDTIESIRNLSTQVIAPWIEKINEAIEKRRKQNAAEDVTIAAPSPPAKADSKRSAQASIVYATKEVGSLLSKFDRMGSSKEDENRIDECVRMVVAAIQVLPNQWKKRHPVLAQWDKKTGSIYMDWYNLQEAGHALMLEPSVAFDWPPELEKKPSIEPEPKPQLVSLSGKKLAFSGRFSRSKADLEVLATFVLADVLKSVTKSCNVLVVGQKPGGRALKKAKEQGILIVSERDFLASLEEAMPPMETFTKALWARKWDISYYGNESDGLCGSFCVPWPKGIKRTKSSLIQVARKDELVRKYLDSGWEEARNPESKMKPLDKNQPGFGWLRAEKERDVRRNIVVKCWNKQRQKPDRISSALLWEMLKYRIDDLDVLAIHSSREIESVVAIHLIGGRDRITGELTGIVLQRVWT